jgi:hypothetical protein
VKTYGGVDVVGISGIQKGTNVLAEGKGKIAPLLS